MLQAFQALHLMLGARVILSPSTTLTFWHNYPTRPDPTRQLDPVVFKDCIEYSGSNYSRPFRLGGEGEGVGGYSRVGLNWPVYIVFKGTSSIPSVKSTPCHVKGISFTCSLVIN